MTQTKRQGEKIKVIKLNENDVVEIGGDFYIVKTHNKKVANKDYTYRTAILKHFLRREEFDKVSLLKEEKTNEK